MLIVGLLVLGTMLAAPLASALAIGVDAESVQDMKSAGATPQFGQLWVGTWTKSNWGAFENDLRELRAQGVTPIVMWYYWGDSISINAVKYGGDGRSKSEWDSMAKELARRANAAMAGQEFYLVMEPEFNKNGVSSWDAFDGYLADQAWAIRGIAPTAKIVMGFGHWGGWSIFDRAMAASHYSGFQYLRGSTRDSASSAENSADTLLSITKSLKAQWGKGVVMYDFAVATYGGWEGVQERAIQGVAAKARELEAAGMKLLIWRYVHDNSHSSGYYGAAESSWGVVTSWGSKKRAFDDLVSLVRSGGSSGTSPTTATGASTGAIRDVKGNNWWIQASVDGSPTWVAARVNGGSWITMSKQSWGAYAVSAYAPTGATVDIIAKWADGRTATQTHPWPTATATGSATSFDATFSSVSGNDWWVQARVSAPQQVTAVHARIDGGAWVPLAKQSWGAWAASVRAPAGANLELRATSSSGASDTDWVAWR